MESDDERPERDALARLARALRARPEWDCACATVALIGWERPGMARYAAWQNELRSPDAMRRNRFVEIPALHQCGLFRRAAIYAANRVNAAGGAEEEEEGTGTGTSAERGGGGGDAGGGFVGYLDDPRWPVDLAFWLAWFGRRAPRALVAAKLPPDAAPPYRWRQHPRQHTRAHGRCGIDAMRKCKVFFLTRPPPHAGPAHGRDVVVISVGRTLEGWCADLRAAPHAPRAVTAVEWRPKREPPAAATAAPRAADGARAVRLFAYGDANARARVRARVGADWDDEHDWFVA